jgi:DNA-binding XRE family transcriptional regulator
MYAYAEAKPPLSLWTQGRAFPTVLGMDDQSADYKRAFAATLVTLRAERAIGSQTVLGQLVGVSEATVQRWEAPTKPHLPDTWQLRRLAEVLGVEIGELVYPQELTERERQWARRAARAVRTAVEEPSRAAGGHA